MSFFGLTGTLQGDGTALGAGEEGAAVGSGDAGIIPAVEQTMRAPLFVDQGGNSDDEDDSGDDGDPNDADMAGPPNRNYCFLCSEHADPSENIHVRVLFELIKQYHLHSRERLALLIQEHYNAELRQHVAGRPRWPQCQILAHIEKHSPSELVWLTKATRSLTAVIDLMESNGLVVQDATGSRSVDTSKPHILGNYMKLMHERTTYQRQLCACIRSLETGAQGEF